jgi:hypothetical protein
MATIQFKALGKKSPVNLNLRFFHNKINCYAKSNIFINLNDWNKYIYNENCAIYKLNNITVLGENVPSDTTEFNTKTKWHFLIYGYYRILFYSLITQNYNTYLL